MTESYIDYDAKVQDALRSVVKTVLKDAERDGLQGDHHFYVAFKTHAKGVDIPAHLVSRFPDEMTIVLQHKFWGLAVHEDRFEIGLSFNQKPEHLIVPFDAIVGFVDPSVQFALQFHDENDGPEAEHATNPEALQSNDVSSDDSGMFIVDDTGVQEEKTAETAIKKTIENTEEVPSTNTAPPQDNVVTLDAFRKK